MKKVIAFYLPQFHEIPENNQWWGEGFTEWTNTKKSIPLFKNHYQPRIPYSNNYYDLTDIKSIEWQVELAKTYNIHAFCFYHYYFKDGKKLLEKPVEIFLQNKQCDLNFCFSWANEPWSRRWNGKDKDLLMNQDYGGVKEWTDHFYYLLPFFKDNRYIKENNCPIFLIYKPEDISCLSEMISLWNNLALEQGFNGISFIATIRNVFTEITQAELFKHFVRFEPFYSLSKMTKKKKIGLFSNGTIRKTFVVLYETFKSFMFSVGLGSFSCFDYVETWRQINSIETPNEKDILGAFVDWDNSPRRGRKAIIFKGANPKSFGINFSALIKKAKQFSSEYIFINAWNEWAEGTYLEPDSRYGDGYLIQISNALNEK